MLSGLLAVLGLVVWTVAVANSGYLQVRGATATATVVSVDGRRVTVRLPPPVDRTVELGEWSGSPRAGDTVRVRYDPADPDNNEQSGSGHWIMVAVFAVPIAMAGVYSWRVGTGPWRRARRRRSRDEADG